MKTNLSRTAELSDRKVMSLSKNLSRDEKPSCQDQKNCLPSKNPLHERAENCQVPENLSFARPEWLHIT